MRTSDRFSVLNRMCLVWSLLGQAGMFAFSGRRDLSAAAARAGGRIVLSPGTPVHRRVRIALVVPGGVDRGGEHRVIPAILWLIERLARRHDVHVIVPLQEPRAASWELLGAVVHNVAAWPRQLSALRTLLRLHRADPFDIFHAISASAPEVKQVRRARISRPAGCGARHGWRTGVAAGDCLRPARALVARAHSQRVAARGSQTAPSAPIPGNAVAQARPRGE